MALTPQQEAYLAGIADEALSRQAYESKVAELDAARATVQTKVDPKLIEDVRSKTGSEQKQAIRDLQSAISADSEVSRLTVELEAMGNVAAR